MVAVAGRRPWPDDRDRAQAGEPEVGPAPQPEHHGRASPRIVELGGPFGVARADQPDTRLAARRPAWSRLGAAQPCRPPAQRPVQPGCRPAAGALPRIRGQDAAGQVPGGEPGHNARGRADPQQRAEPGPQARRRSSAWPGPAGPPPARPVLAGRIRPAAHRGAPSRRPSDSRRSSPNPQPQAQCVADLGQPSDGTSGQVRQRPGDIRMIRSHAAGADLAQVHGPLQRRQRARRGRETRGAVRCRDLRVQPPPGAPQPAACTLPGLLHPRAATAAGLRQLAVAEQFGPADRAAARPSRPPGRAAARTAGPDTGAAPAACSARSPPPVAVRRTGTDWPPGSA